MIYWKHIMPFRSDEHTHGLWIWWTSRAAQRRTRRTLKVGIYISNRRQYLEYFSHRRYPHSHPLININQTSRQWFCDALIYPYFGGKASGAVNEWKPPNRPQCISFREISYIVGLVWCGIVLRSAVWCVSCDARLRPPRIECSHCSNSHNYSAQRGIRVYPRLVFHGLPVPWPQIWEKQLQKSTST